MKGITIAFIFIMGCSSHIRDEHVVNDVLRHRTLGSVGIFSSDIRSERFDQKMPVCEADIGRMDDGEEREICQQHVREDEIRRRFILDSHAYPYWYRGQ